MITRLLGRYPRVTVVVTVWLLEGAYITNTTGCGWWRNAP